MITLFNTGILSGKGNPSAVFGAARIMLLTGINGASLQNRLTDSVKAECRIADAGKKQGTTALSVSSARIGQSLRTEKRCGKRIRSAEVSRNITDLPNAPGRRAVGRSTEKSGILRKTPCIFGSFSAKSA